MNFAATLSEHPIPATAVGEVAGYLMETFGEQADLLCVFVSPHHAGALEDIAAAFQTILDPKVFIGCAANGIIGPGKEVENGPAISAWAGNVGKVEPVRLEVIDTPTGRAISGWPLHTGWVPAAAVLIADPFSFPVDPLFDVLNGAGGFPRVIGGMASAGIAPGTNRLVFNGEVYDSGAVGVLIAKDETKTIQTVLAQGCRPIGSPLVVTSSEGNVIHQLAGEPALKRLTEILNSELDQDEIELAREGLLVGVVIDEHKSEFSLGDFLIRTFINADPTTGSIVIGEKVEVGTTIQFQIRDPEAADKEFRHLIEDALMDDESIEDSEIKSGLLFSCNGRGEKMFGDLDHDAQTLVEVIGEVPVAGFFADGEFGPVGGKNYVHGFSASIALFA